MEILTTQENSFYRIGIKGEVDASSSIHLDEAIGKALEADQLKILFDCAELDYISSAGLGVFVSYVKDFKQRAGKFAFAGLKPEVFNVFKMLGLHEILHIGETENSAIQYLNEV
jgi:anti-sigma B factor antagonist